MSLTYSHWSSERTLEKVFGDTETLRSLVQAFMDSYSTSLRNLQNHCGTDKVLWDEIHNLRSMFGIFNADTAYELAVSLDRIRQQGLPVPDEDRMRLILTLQSFAHELQHYLDQAR